MIIWIAITGIHVCGSCKSVRPPLFLVFCVNQDMIVIVRKPFSIVSNCVFLLPNSICNEIHTAKNLIA